MYMYSVFTSGLQNFEFQYHNGMILFTSNYNYMINVLAEVGLVFRLSFESRECFQEDKCSILSVK